MPPNIKAASAALQAYYKAMKWQTNHASEQWPLLEQITVRPTVTPSLRHRYGAVTPPLRHRYATVTALLRHRYGTVTALLRHRDGAVAAPSQSPVAITVAKPPGQSPGVRARNGRNGHHRRARRSPSSASPRPTTSSPSCSRRVSPARASHRSCSTRWSWARRGSSSVTSLTGRSFSRARRRWRRRWRRSCTPTSCAARSAFCDSSQSSTARRPRCE